MQKYPKTKISQDDVRVLKYFQQSGYNNAIIAGGSIRDSYFKKPIKDIDIYVQHPHHMSKSAPPLYFNVLNEKEVYELIKFHFEKPSYWRALYKGNKSGDEIEDIDMIKNSSLSAGAAKIEFFIQFRIFYQNYEVIGTIYTPLEYMERFFAVNLSKCYSNGITLTYPHKFLEDATKHNLTVEGELNKAEYRRSMLRYLPRIKKKYPSFTIVDTLRDKYKNKK